MGSKSLKIVWESNTIVSGEMPSFVSQLPISNSNGTEGNASQSSRVSDFRIPEQSVVFHGGGASNNNRVYNSATLINPTLHPDLQFGAFEKMLQEQKGSQTNQVSNSGGNHENWIEPNMEGASPLTDTSTEMDADDKNQRFDADLSNPFLASGSSDQPKEKSSEQKTLRRLAQNREAARKSRLRKKAYVQQLENSRLKLTQLEQEVHRARQQGVQISSSGDKSQSNGGNGALAFEVEYSRWLDEQSRHINELRTAVNAHASDSELRNVVDNTTSHFNNIFRLKGTAAKSNVFHIIYGMWKTPAERCFLWIGGFRSSELLKLLVNHLEPLTEQQVANIDNLQQSSQQAEEALSQGMDALQQSLAETLASGAPPAPSGSSGNVANYMGQMAMAMGKLGALEGFLHQADNLREQTLQQMHRILTTRQSARALLAIHDYFSRLRALSALWLARPQE